jgi:hypothetical protein
VLVLVLLELELAQVPALLELAQVPARVLVLVLVDALAFYEK